MIEHKPRQRNSSSASVTSSGYTSLNSNISEPINSKNSKRQSNISTQSNRQVERYQSPLERIISVFKRFKKTEKPEPERKVKINWNHYTDERLPFSGREYWTPTSSRAESPCPSTWSTRSAGVLDSPVIIALDRETRSIRSSRGTTPPPIETIPENVPTNFVETCFLDGTTLTKRQRPVSEFTQPEEVLPKSRKVVRRRSCADSFRVSKFDARTEPPVVVTPPKLIVTPPKNSRKIQKKAATLPSKLPVPIAGLVRQRTSDSGFSNNSCPPIRGGLRRSVSPTFSLTSEPAQRPIPQLRRGGSLRLPRRPRSLIEERGHSPLPPTRPGHRHDNCFSHSPPVKPVALPRGARVPPTMLRIENDPRPSPRPSRFQNPSTPPKSEPWKFNPVLHEEPLMEAGSTSPASRIRKILADETYRGELQIGKTLSLASGEFSEVFVLNLSKPGSSGRPTSLILMSEDNNSVQNWLEGSQMES